MTRNKFPWNNLSQFLFARDFLGLFPRGCLDIWEYKHI